MPLKKLDVKGLATAEGEVKPGKEGGKEELTLFWCPSCAGYFTYAGGSISILERKKLRLTNLE